MTFTVIDFLIDNFTSRMGERRPETATRGVP